MNSIESKKIKAIIIFEILGRPPEHLKEALEKIIEQLGNEKGVEIQNKKINEPTQIKETKNFFTTFAEVEIEFEEIMTIAVLLFKYMPAHIDIISPKKISLANNDWNTLFNELARRLHGYDEITRVLQNEKFVLEKKLKEVLGEGKDKNLKKEDNKE